MKKKLLGVSCISLLLATGVLLYSWSEKKLNQKVDVVVKESFSADNLIDKAEQEIKGKYLNNQKQSDIEVLYKGATAAEIPHVFVEQIPEDFQVKTEDDKTLFMKLMTPHLLRTNEKILNERKAILVLNEKIKSNQPLTQKEHHFFKVMSEKYDVMDLKADSSRISELVKRVDIIPVSLGMAISIWATNWGQNNKQSPFLEHAWNGTIAYEPVKFNELSKATDSFALQLNTRSQLLSFRDDRQRHRFFSNKLSFGWVQVHNMKNYLHKIPTFIDQLALIYPLGYIKELDNACFKEGCFLTK